MWGTDYCHAQFYKLTVHCYAILYEQLPAYQPASMRTLTPPDRMRKRLKRSNGSPILGLDECSSPNTTTKTPNPALDCIVYFGPPLMPSTQEIRLQQLLDRVPFSERWIVDLTPDAEGYRTAHFTPRDQSEEIEVKYVVDNMAKNMRIPFSRYSIPDRSNDASTPNHLQDSSRPNTPKEHLHIKTISPNDTPCPLYYKPNDSVANQRMVFAYSDDKQFGYSCGSVTFDIPSNTPPEAVQPSMWHAHKTWLETTKEPMTWEVYHSHMMAYRFDFDLHSHKELLSYIRGMCMHKFLRFAAAQYRVGPRGYRIKPWKKVHRIEAQYTPPSTCTIDSMFDEMESISSWHKMWIDDPHQVVCKEAYMHFIKVYEQDMYLSVERRNYLIWHLKHKRQQHYQARFTNGLERGDPFSGEVPIHPDYEYFEFDY